jgi:phosphoserine phosphatase
MRRPHEVLVFDLDETVLRVNSFPRWVLFLITGRMPGLGVRRRIALSLRAQALLFRRKLGGIDHAALLRRLHVAWRSATSGDGEAMASRFRSALLRQVRPNLQPLLAMVAAERMDAVLATAAASDYAAPLGRQLGFRHVLATFGDDDPAQRVNAGACKRDRVLALLQARGWGGRKLILFTDHLDDLPLMQASAAICWFGAPEALPSVSASASHARFVACCDLGADAMAATLQALCTPEVAQPEAWREMTAP